MIRHPTFLPFVGFTLICVWPGAYFFAYDAAQVQLMGGSAVLVVAAVSAVLWLIGICLAVGPTLLPIRWSMARAFTVGIVGVYVLFLHQAIRTWLIEVFSAGRILPSVIYLFSFVGSVALTCRLSRHGPVRVALVIAAALMTAFPVGKLILIHEAPLVPSADADRLGLESVVAAPALTKENVYYIILDGYAGRAALKTYLGYDIDPFLQEMRNLEYSYIDFARTNYTSTHVSLMAMLEMDYVVNENSPKYEDRKDFFPFKFQHGRAPAVVRKISSAGYNFIYVGSSWSPCQPRGEFKCLSSLSSSSKYEFIKQVTAAFLGPTSVPATMRILSRSGNDDALALLSRAVEDLTGRARPFFVFVHHLSPHAPYVRADCLPDLSGEVGREQYKNSIKCVNRRVQSLAKQIHALDRDAIVIFQSDHGSDFKVNWKLPGRAWSDAAIDERSSIFNLIHLPEPCRKWLRPNLSQINTMRLVVGCLERRPPEYVKERTYVTTYEPYPDFGVAWEVTDRLPEHRGGGINPTSTRAP